MTPLLQLDAVAKAYLRGPRELRVLREVSLTVEPGQFVGIYGGRGSRQDDAAAPRGRLRGA